MTLDTDQIVTVVTTGDRASSASGTVIELDLSRFQTGRWALQLDGVFAKRTQPVCVIAYGVAALAVAWWAQLSPRSYEIHTRRDIRGSAEHCARPGWYRCGCTRWSDHAATLPIHSGSIVRFRYRSDAKVC